MGFDDGQIMLDSANGAYYAGQTVFGRIVFDQGKPKTIHGIYVSCKGFCKVHWQTTEVRRVGDRDIEETIDHDSYEEYFKRKIFVVGSENGEYNLNPGHHEYEFNCPIPNNSPSSFESEYAHLRYQVKVVMVTTGMFSMNKEKRVPIKVHAPIDLNLNPYCKEPIQSEIISTYCCWCVNSGSSEVRVKLPVGGYCPGQVIPIEVNVVNHSSVEIEEIKMAIKKNIKYEATSHGATRHENEYIAEVKCGPVAGGTTPSWNLEMPVPVMEVPNLDGCRFINIDYVFRIKTEVSGCHEGEEETYPIIIGTIPLVGFQDQLPNPLQDQLPSTGPNGHPTNFTPMAIIAQPLPNPNNNANYPQNTPYPGGNPSYPNPSQYPITNTSYPNANAGYPGSPNQGSYQGHPNVYPPPGNLPQPSPYPAPNPGQPYPGANPAQPYPGAYPAQPYPAANAGQQYPGPNACQQYPGPTAGQPYPGPHAGQPYPGANPSVTNANLVQSGNYGFTAPTGEDSSNTPLLPPGSNVPYPTNPGVNPYQSPSAPTTDKFALPACKGDGWKVEIWGMGLEIPLYPNETRHGPFYVDILSGRPGLQPAKHNSSAYNGNIKILAIMSAFHL